MSGPQNTNLEPNNRRRNRYLPLFLTLLGLIAVGVVSAAVAVHLRKPIHGRQISNPQNLASLVANHFALTENRSIEKITFFQCSYLSFPEASGVPGYSALVRLGGPIDTDSAGEMREYRRKRKVFIYKKQGQDWTLYPTVDFSRPSRQEHPCEK